MAVRRLDPEQPPSFAFTPENAAWARATIAKYPEGKQASAVIPLLWRAQEQNGGWTTEPAMRAIADQLGMAYIRVYEIATFYTMFQLSPVGKVAHIQVCGTTPCMLRGARDLVSVCKRRIAEHSHEVSADGKFSWEEVECLGSCANAPMVQIWSDTYEDLTPEAFEHLIDAFAKGNPPKPGSQTGRTASCPSTGPTSLTDPSLYDGSGVGVWQKRFHDAQAAAVASVPVAAPAATPVPAVSVAAAPATPPKPPISPAVAAAIANAGLVPELEARGGGKAMSVQELESLKAQAKAGLLPGAMMAALAASTPGSNADVVPEARFQYDVAPEKPPLLTSPRGGKGDELGLIWGVADKLEAKMNALGVWHFDQIAAWTPAHVAWFEGAMEGFKGRIQRDKWIEQCQKLAAGWRPDDSVGERPKG